jgi:hypothetical protein
VQRAARLAISLALLSGCSAVPADPAFLGARVESVDCPDGQPECIRVFSEVDGNRAGIGSCILYATTGAEGSRVSVAASGELELVPGTPFEWVVAVPSHLHNWNPVCVPTAEG